MFKLTFIIQEFQSKYDYPVKSENSESCDIIHNIMAFPDWLVSFRLFLHSAEDTDSRKPSAPRNTKEKAHSCHNYQI